MTFLKKIDILALEDSPILKNFIKNELKLILKENLSSIEIASSLTTAKKLISNKKFDLCLVDLNINNKILGHKFVKECQNFNIIPIVTTAVAGQLKSNTRVF